MSDHDELLGGLVANLGANLKAVRLLRGMTQGELASLSGIPRSTLANLETGDSNPTLAVLAQLATSLRLSIEELLSPPRAACQLFPRGTLRTRNHGRGQRKVIVHKLLPHPIPGMEIDRLELQPGARMVGSPHRSGTHEYLTCEQGRITLAVAGERFELAAGDVAAFRGDEKHSYSNPGKGTAIGFSVVTLSPMMS